MATPEKKNKLWIDNEFLSFGIQQVFIHDRD